MNYYRSYLLLSNRKERVVLNGQSFCWSNVCSGFPEELIVGPLLFLIQINELLDNLSTNSNVSSDNMSIFSIFNDVNTSEKKLNGDLKKINN